MNENCEHPNFLTRCLVNRIPDRESMRFVAEIRIICSTCKAKFRFKGLPLGVLFEGAAMTPDGFEAKLAVEPTGERDIAIPEAKVKPTGLES